MIPATHPNTHFHGIFKWESRQRKKITLFFLLYWQCKFWRLLVWVRSGFFFRWMSDPFWSVNFCVCVWTLVCKNADECLTVPTSWPTATQSQDLIFECVMEKLHWTILWYYGHDKNYWYHITPNDNTYIHIYIYINSNLMIRFNTSLWTCAANILVQI